MKQKITIISLGLAILAVLFVLPNNADALTSGCCQILCPPLPSQPKCVNSAELENYCYPAQLVSLCATPGGAPVLPNDISATSVPDKSCSEIPECPQYSGLKKAGAVVGFINPLCKTDQPCSIPIIIGNIIRAVLGIVGSIALLMFIYGGITWMISQGNQEKVKTAKEILVWATLGLVVIFAGYILVEFIIKAAA